MQQVCAHWGHCPLGTPQCWWSWSHLFQKLLPAIQKLGANTALGNQPVMKRVKCLLKAPVTPNFGRTGQFAHGLACALPTCLLLLRRDHLKNHSVKVHLGLFCLPPGIFPSPLSVSISSRSPDSQVPAKHTFHGPSVRTSSPAKLRHVTSINPHQRPLFLCYSPCRCSL